MKNIVHCTKTSRLITTEIMPRNLNEIVRSWIRLRYMGAACMPNIVSYKSTAHALQYTTIESVHSMPYRDLCPGRVPSVHAPQGVPVSCTLHFSQCRKTLYIFMLPTQKVYTNNLCMALLASSGRIFKELLRKIGSAWPGVDLRFCPWLLLFKYWTGGSNLSSSLCP